MAAGYDGSIRIDSKIDTKGFNGGVSSITKSLKGLTKTIGIAFGVQALIAVGKAAIDLASDLEETQNVVDVTFKGMAESINEFAKTSLEQFGLSELSAKRYTSTMGAMLKSSGFGTKAAAEMSIEMAKLTADMASFYNLDTDTAFQKIRAGISGETEPLKQLGINLNVANLEAFALSQGIKKSYKEMSQSEQVMLRYNYLLKASADSQGDFARNSGNWANQTKILSERWRELLGILGRGLIEIGLPVVKFLNKVLEILIKIFSKIGDIYSAITGRKLVKENNQIANSADEAANSEFDLADGIGKAGKEIKKQLANFDELNILQKDLADSGNGIGINFDNSNFSDLNTVGNESNFKGIKKELEDFFYGVENRYRGLRQELLIPIKVPAPVVEPLKNPVWNPDFGLGGVPTLVPAPSFEPLPNPIWEPNWGLFNSLYAEGEKTNNYSYSWGIRLQESLAYTRIRLAEIASEMGLDIKTAFLDYQAETETSTRSWGTELLTNLNILSENVRTNTEKLTQAISTNFENWRISSRQSVEAWKKDISKMVYQTASNALTNVNAFLQSSSSSIVSWSKATGEDLKNWGNGIVSIAHQTAYNFVETIVDGLKSAWEKIKEYSKTTGEKLSGSFSGSFSLPSPGVVALGIIGTIGAALNLTRGGFIPALATGAVIPPNSEFLAILGDQKSGRNIETPESLLRQIMREELSNLMAGGDTNLNLTLQIGDETITERIINNINRQSRISGKTVITI